MTVNCLLEEVIVLVIFVLVQLDESVFLPLVISSYLGAHCDTLVCEQSSDVKNFNIL